MTEPLVTAETMRWQQRDRELVRLRQKVAALEADLAFARECFEQALRGWDLETYKGCASHPWPHKTIYERRTEIEATVRARQAPPEVPR